MNMKPDWHNEVEELTREEALALFKLGIEVKCEMYSAPDHWQEYELLHEMDLMPYLDCIDFFYLGDRPQC